MRWITVFLLISSWLVVPETVLGQYIKQPGKLAIYYGFPSLVNGSAGDISKAIDEFDDYDIVVFGNGLENPNHSDHTNTVAIINNLQISPNPTAIFGYIPIGVKTDFLSKTMLQHNIKIWAAWGVFGITLAPAVNLSRSDIKDRVDAWAKMGVAGIFLDQAGYDFGVSRQRQNQVIHYVHNKGLRVFINAFIPDDIFNPAIDPNFNPTGDPTSLGSNDIYLQESFQIIMGEFQDPTIWAKRSNKAIFYKSRFGTQIAAITTVSDDNPIFDQEKFDYAWWSAFLFGFDMIGWGEQYYSASNSNLQYRLRPDLNQVEQNITTLVNKVRTPIQSVNVTTDNGSIIVGDFLTRSSKPGIAVRCAELRDCDGAIIGKALQGLPSGVGKIMVLVMEQ